MSSGICGTPEKAACRCMHLATKDIDCVEVFAGIKTVANGFRHLLGSSGKYTHFEISVLFAGYWGTPLRPSSWKMDRIKTS